MKTYLRSVSWTMVLLVFLGSFGEEFVRNFFAALSSIVGHGAITGKAATAAASIAVLAAAKVALPLAAGVIIKGTKAPPGPPVASGTSVMPHGEEIEQR